MRGCGLASGRKSGQCANNNNNNNNNNTATTVQHIHNISNTFLSAIKYNYYLPVYKRITLSIYAYLLFSLLLLLLLLIFFSKSSNRPPHPPLFSSRLRLILLLLFCFVVVALSSTLSSSFAFSRLDFRFVSVSPPPLLTSALSVLR